MPHVLVPVIALHVTPHENPEMDYISEYDILLFLGSGDAGTKANALVADPIRTKSSMYYECTALGMSL